MRELNGAGHLTPDTAADLDEGLLDPADTAAARAHVAGCAACTGLLEELAELRRILAADDPGPLPASLVDRLASALAAPAAEESSAPRVPRPRKRPGWVRPALSLAAAVAALGALVGGLTVLPRNQSGGSAGSSAASGAGSKASSPASAGAAGGGSSLSGGVSAGSPRPGRGPRALSPAPSSNSGTTYASTDAALLRQARALLRQEELAVAARAAGSATGDPACVRALSGPAPTLVDNGRYAGRPALLVVQRTRGRLVATVLPRPCTARDAGHPLQTATG